MKSAIEIRQAFFDFWTSEPRNHKEIPNVSLVPVNDPTLLFVNSGMFPLVPYLLGQKHPLGSRVCNFQKSLRVGEIEGIGDNRHTTFFEMMGNWSLGDYFKAEQLPWFLKLYHEYFGLDINRLYVTVFAGDENAAYDSESEQIWIKAFAEYGINAKVGESLSDFYKNFDEKGNLIDPKNVFKIFKLKKNWWDRGSFVAGEPGGPDSEMFYDMGKEHELYADEENGVDSDNGRFVEVGNSVFMEFKLNKDLKWEKLAQQNVDFGGGYERVVMCVQGKNDIFETDLFEPVISHIEKITGKKYVNKPEDEFTKHFRVVADHIRGAVFILAEGVSPSNKDQGYILRRLIRRMLRHARYLGHDGNFAYELAKIVVEIYAEAHSHLKANEAFILGEIAKEEEKFIKTLQRGLKEFEKISSEEIDGAKAFWMYETYGFPFEMIMEEMQSRGMKFDEEKLANDFNQAKESHQSLSRSGAEKKFKGGLADQSTQTVRLHTTQHLLLAALREVLGSHVHQKGSNITAERIRIDFPHSDKLTDEEVVQVERIVNEKISEGWNVIKKVLPKEEAEKIGAEMEFGSKYADLVNVYFIVSPEVEPETFDYSAVSSDKIFSKEFCGGPHVENTNEIAASGKFRIAKQESVGSGVRRLKAVLE